MKTALITGVNGQDGSYLAELLLKKKYNVHGTIRRSSTFNTKRIEHLIKNKNFNFYYSDVQDYASLNKIIINTKPDEIYNLAAQSHVKVSFELANYTTIANSIGVLNLLEIIKQNKLNTKFYQASTSEMFGDTKIKPQNETTPFDPNSPYALSKLSGHLSVRNYRKSYKIFACGGILFNHESPRRGETFITRKTTLAVSRIKNGSKEILTVGNLDAKRDWGYAPEYVEGMWRMLQNSKPKDYVLATGKQISVRDFISKSFNHIGVSIIWEGKGLREKGIDKKNNKTLVKINPKYYRPNEVNSLLGDASLAKKELGWKPKVDIDGLVKKMMEHDLKYVLK